MANAFLPRALHKSTSSPRALAVPHPASRRSRRPKIAWQGAGRGMGSRAPTPPRGGAPEVANEPTPGGTRVLGCAPCPSTRAPCPARRARVPRIVFRPPPPKQVCKGAPPPPRNSRVQTPIVRPPPAFFSSAPPRRRARVGGTSSGQGSTRISCIFFLFFLLGRRWAAPKR